MPKCGSTCVEIVKNMIHSQTYVGWKCESGTRGFTPYPGKNCAEIHLTLNSGSETSISDQKRVEKSFLKLFFM